MQTSLEGHAGVPLSVFLVCPKWSYSITAPPSLITKVQVVHDRVYHVPL